MYLKHVKRELTNRKPMNILVHTCIDYINWNYNLVINHTYKLIYSLTLTFYIFNRCNTYFVNYTLFILQKAFIKISLTCIFYTDYKRKC